MLVVTAAAHLVIPVVMWIRQDSLRSEIARQHADFSSTTLDDSVHAALLAATIFHALLLLLNVFLVWKLATGKPWARRLTTVSQALSIVFSLASWSTSTMFHAVIPVIVVLQLITIVLLWTASSRSFFQTRTLAKV